VASARVGRLRVGAAIVALAVLVWIAYETISAGSDVPPAQPQGPTRLSSGAASGKRIDGKSWVLDYDSAVMTPDGSGAEIDNVHDGILYRNGKPYMRMRAKHVSANLNADDFRVIGPVSFVEISGNHRSLETIDAHYTGALQTLELDNPTIIRQGPATLRVAKATINFRTGATQLGRIVGTL